MPLTRQQVEKILINRAGRRMTFVGMDGATTDGTNADLSDPIATALFAMGVSIADFSMPADGDLVNVADYAQLLDRAELRLLENVLGNMNMVTITVGSRSESLSQFSQELEALITRKQRTVENNYGGLGTLSGGSINNNFQQKNDDLESASDIGIFQ
jgi:hypothetical protein